jgi:hypothetical protein
MNAIRVTLHPSPDGSVHLPLPPELRGVDRLRVVAWLEPEPPEKNKQGAGAWAIQARGIAKLSPGESHDEARMSSLQRRFGVS